MREAKNNINECFAFSYNGKSKKKTISHWQGNSKIQDLSNLIMKTLTD